MGYDGSTIVECLRRIFGLGDEFVCSVVGDNGALGHEDQDRDRGDLVPKID